MSIVRRVWGALSKIIHGNAWSIAWPMADAQLTLVAIMIKVLISFTTTMKMPTTCF